MGICSLRTLTPPFHGICNLRSRQKHCRHYHFHLLCRPLAWNAKWNHCLARHSRCASISASDPEQVRRMAAVVLKQRLSCSAAARPPSHSRANHDLSSAQLHHHLGLTHLNGHLHARHALYVLLAKMTHLGHVIPPISPI